MTMKAICLWQPWASLWCSDAKVHETRHWPTSHRGWLLVHAAKRRIDVSGNRLDDICNGLFGNHWAIELPRGALVGKVALVACDPTENIPISYGQTDLECGDFSPGRFAWRRGAFEVFKEPIPYRGAQGFFNVPNDVIDTAIVAVRSFQ